MSSRDGHRFSSASPQGERAGTSARPAKTRRSGRKRMGAWVQVAAGLTVLAVVPMAHVQYPVIDAAAVAQLVTQLRTLQEQLVTAREQLLRAQAQLDAMTGSRGMGALLSGTTRNYLPSTWAELQSVRQGMEGPHAALSRAVRHAVQANAVLSEQELAKLSGRERQLHGAARDAAALLEVLAGEALANTSSRFAAVQQLIEAIGAAGDQKAILELQARIAAEQGMLQNEQTKLEVLYRAAQAQEWARRQQLREAIVAGHGRFGERFQPRPPAQRP